MGTAHPPPLSEYPKIPRYSDHPGTVHGWHCTLLSEYPPTIPGQYTNGHMNSAFPSQSTLRSQDTLTIPGRYMSLLEGSSCNSRCELPYINHQAELLLTSVFSLSLPLSLLVYQHTVYTHTPAAYSDLAANTTTIPCTVGVHALAVLPACLL